MKKTKKNELTLAILEEAYLGNTDIQCWLLSAHDTKTGDPLHYEVSIVCDAGLHEWMSESADLYWKFMDYQMAYECWSSIVNKYIKK